MSMKYEVFLVKFFQLSTRPQIRLEIGRKSAGFWPISGQKKFENILVKILPKFSQKSAENQPILGPKKPDGLSGFEDWALGGLGPPKKRLGRAGFGLSPMPDPSLPPVLKYSIFIFRILPINYKFKLPVTIVKFSKYPYIYD